MASDNDKNPTRRAAIVAGGLGVGAAGLAALHGHGGGHGGNHNPGAGSGAGPSQPGEPRPATSRMPVVYLPHGGGPWPFVDLGFDPKEMAPLADYLRSVAAVPRQRAQGVAGRVGALGRGRADGDDRARARRCSTTTTAFRPSRTRSPGPRRATPRWRRACAQLLGRGRHRRRAEDAKRGFDHGTFVPLKLAYPDADVPTVQLSLSPRARSRASTSRSAARSRRCATRACSSSAAA